MALGVPLGGGPQDRGTPGLVRACLVAVMALLIIGAAACSSGPQVRPHRATKTTSATSTTVKSVQLQWSAPEQIDTNENGLGDVSCPTATFCVAVGSTGPGVVSSAFIWNGTSWSATAPQLFAQDTSGFNHISCPTASFCLAGAPDGGALIWDGTSWSASSQIRWPNPNDGITNVSCATASFCLAGDEDGDIRVWNGTSWSIDHQVVPGTTSGGAHAVSCPSAAFCVAVNVLGNAIVWNGTSWSAPQSIDPNLASARGPAATSSNGHPSLGMKSVSCPTTSFCVAVGSDGSVVIGRRAG